VKHRSVLYSMIHVGAHSNRSDLEVRVIKEFSPTMKTCPNSNAMISHRAFSRGHHSVSWGAEDFRFQIYNDIKYLIQAYNDRG
jgi:hypothetical protein